MSELDNARSRLWTAAKAWKGFSHAACRPTDLETILDELDRLEQWCDSCQGPYTGWLAEQYGGHWDTCPRRPGA